MHVFYGMNWKMNVNDELLRTQKETVVAYFELLFLPMQRGSK